MVFLNFILFLEVHHDVAIDLSQRRHSTKKIWRVEADGVLKQYFLFIYTIA